MLYIAPAHQDRLHDSKLLKTSTIINKTHATSCAAKQNIASTAITYN